MRGNALCRKTGTILRGRSHVFLQDVFEPRAGHRGAACVEKDFCRLPSGALRSASVGLQSRLTRALMLSHPIAELHEQRGLRADRIWPVFSCNDCRLLKILQKLARTAHVVIVYPSELFALTAWKMSLELLDTDRIELGERSFAAVLPVAHMRRGAQIALNRGGLITRRHQLGG